MKSTSFMISALILLVNFLLPLSYVKAQDTPSGKFLGSYYNGRNFETPVFTREDAAINFGWGWGSPDPSVDEDSFSVRWRGNFNFEDGDYEFIVRSDDGVRLFIDGNKIIDSWKGQHYITFKAIRRLTAGSHLIVVEYFEHIQSATIKAEWKKLSSDTTGTQTGTTGGTSGGTTGQSTATTPSLYASLYKSSCEELVVNPDKGEAPLSVEFTAAGYDPYGAIQNYRIDTGDRTASDSVITTEDYFSTFEYKNPGTYTAVLSVKDSKGNLLTGEECKKKIVVGGEPRNIGGGGPTVYPTASVSALPATGIFDSSYSLVIITIPLALFGILLNRRFSKL